MITLTQTCQTFEEICGGMVHTQRHRVGGGVEERYDRWLNVGVYMGTQVLYSVLLRFPFIHIFQAFCI